MRHFLSCAAAMTLAAAPFAAQAQPSPAPAAAPVPAAPLAPPPRPVFDANGVVHVPAFDLPPSQLSSPEAQGFMRLRAKMGGMAPPANLGIAEARAGLTKMFGSQVVIVRAQYPVDIAESAIAGVPVRIVTPQGKAFDPDRVLINLHGGAFSMCWETCSLLELMPIASLGGYKVITVNYRMAPEAEHPAAVEDAAAVYRELLKSYKPDHIGVYGCSAGGALTAELAAWLPTHGLPQAGAAGIFGAGGVRFETGDSAYVAGYIDGSFPPPPRPGEKAGDLTHGYFAHADMADPIISPALHPDVIAKFPPTLIITGTRAMDMSPAIVTNSALLKAGVSSTLVVGEGMGHCYIMTPQFPESRDAYQVIIAFFKRNLR